jgi:hypothetical protein
MTAYEKRLRGSSTAQLSSALGYKARCPVALCHAVGVQLLEESIAVGEMSDLQVLSVV